MEHAVSADRDLVSPKISGTRERCEHIMLMWSTHARHLAVYLVALDGQMPVRVKRDDRDDVGVSWVLNCSPAANHASMVRLSSGDEVSAIKAMSGALCIMDSACYMER